MPARVIDTAVVEIVPDLSALAQLQRKVDQQLRGTTQLFDRMGNDVDDVFKQVARDADKAFNEVQREATRSLEQVSEEAAEAGIAIDASLSRGAEGAESSFEELSRRARSELSEVERKATTTAATMSAKFKAAGVAAGVAIGGIAIATTAGLGAITGFGLISAAQLEQTQVSFNALLGTAEKGQAVFKELQQFAAVTPFEFPEVAAAAKRFFAFNQAVGLTDEQVFDFLTTVGDLASVTGAGAEGLNRIALALSQIASKGKTSLEELMQIGEAVPGFSAIGAVAQSLGITTAEAMERISRGEIDAVTGINALLKGMQQFPGAAGAMEKQSQTLLGVFSTFKDTLSQTLANAFQPVIPAVKESLAEITPILGQALGQLGPALGDLLATLLPALGSLVQGIVPILTPIIQAFGDIAANVDGLIAPLGSAISGLLMPLAQLGPVIGDTLAVIGTAFLRVFDAARPLFAALGDVLPPILDALLPIIDQLSGVLALTLAPIFEVLADIIRAVGPPITLIVEAIGALLAPVLELIAPLIDGLLEAIEPLIPVLDDLLLPIVDLVVALTPLIDLFVASVRVITPLLIPLTKLLSIFVAMVAQKFVVGVITQLTGALNLLLTPVNALIGPMTFIADWVANIDWAKTGRAITDALGGALRTVGNAFTNFLNTATSIPGKIRDKFVELSVSIAKPFVTVGDAIYGAFKKAFNGVAGIWNNTVGKLKWQVPSWVPGIGGNSIGVPQIPTLAHGGMAFGPAIIGEDASTSPEVALPLNDPRAMNALVAAIERAGGGGGTTHQTIIVEIDGQQLQGRIVKTIDEHDRQIKRRAGTGAR